MKRDVAIDLEALGFGSECRGVVYLTDRYDRPKSDVKHQPSTPSFTLSLEPNAPNTHYRMDIHKEKDRIDSISFFVFDGEGDLAFEDALERFEFEAVGSFVYPYKDRSERIMIDDDFVTTLDAYLVNSKRFYSKEFKRAIDTFVRYADANMETDSYVYSDIVDRFDKELSQIGLEK